VSAHLLAPDWSTRNQCHTLVYARKMLAARLSRARGPEPKIASNTTIRHSGYAWSDISKENIIVRLYSTDIVTFQSDGSAILDWEGYHTVTTNDRINGILPLGYGVSGLAQLTIRTPLGIHAVPLGVRVHIGARGAVKWERRYSGVWRKAQRFTGDNTWRRADYAAKKFPYGGE